MMTQPLLAQVRTTILRGSRTGSTRWFFASSTDHTALLRDSQVHRLPASPSASGVVTHSYVMASAGMDTAMVIKVPQLHLARLFVVADTGGSEDTWSNPILFGAKVINRTLGRMDVVCGKLVDAALLDTQAKSSVIVRARSTLHGLSEWVLEGYRSIQHERTLGSPPLDQAPCPRNRILLGLSMNELSALVDLANGSTLKPNGTIDSSIAATWEQLAREFIQQSLSPEALLYQSKGAALELIEHAADTSDFANTCGGAMAIFRF